MADYAQMYKTLFQAMTKAIHILQEAQIATEEMYISAEPPQNSLLSHQNQKTTTTDSYYTTKTVSAQKMVTVKQCRTWRTDGASDTI